MWDQIASDASIATAVAALEANGFHAIVVENGEAAKQKALEILPAGAEVMNMTSVTVDTVGLANEINESGKFNSVRKQFATMDKEKQHREMQRLGAAPEWVVGSAHAVTEDGHVLIASKTGSQLPAYVFGADHVIWIVGAQKIVKNTEDGMKRIQEYTLPLENVRAQKAYGVGSAINNLLIINASNTPNRITVIFVKEKLGF